MINQYELNITRLILACFLFAVTMVLMAFAGLAVIFPGLALKSASKEDLYVKIRGSSIRYRLADYGGQDVILLHGFGGRLEHWEPIVNHLSSGRIFSIDIVGFGLSDRPNIDYTLETHRSYILSLMDALGIREAVLVGSSMGASIALWTAARSPERVKAAVLFAPSAYPGSLSHRWPMGMFCRPGIANTIASGLARTGLFQRLFPLSRARQALGVTSSYNQDFADILSVVQKPVLILWSRSDRRVPFSYSNVYRQYLPKAVLVERALDAGHNIKKDAINSSSHINAFLKEIQRTMSL